jgi:exonuclease SbcD
MYLARDAEESIVIAGDVFNRVNPTSEMISEFFHWLSLCGDYKVPVYILAGNHDSGVDWVNTKMVGNASMSGITVISGLGTVSIREHGTKRDILMVPHLPLAERQNLYGSDNPDFVMWNALDNTPDLRDKCEMCITHGQVVQSDYTNDIFFEAGNAMELYPDSLSELKLMVAGHIHDHRVYGKVVYPGSLTINNFGEVDEQKGYLRVNISTLKWEWFPFSEENVTPWRHVEIDLTEKDESSLDPEVIERIVSGAVIKITVYAKRYGIINESYIRQLFNQYGKVTRFETVVVADGESVDDVQEYQRLSHIDLLRNFIQGEDAKAEIKKHAMALGKPIIEGVVE